MQEEAFPVQLRDPVLARTQEKHQIRITYGHGFKVAAKACVMTVIMLLLLLSGDVELNPGPPKHGENASHNSHNLGRNLLCSS